MESAQDQVYDGSNHHLGQGFFWGRELPRLQNVYFKWEIQERLFNMMWRGLTKCGFHSLNGIVDGKDLFKIALPSVLRINRSQ